jgi:hypothetical protein
MGKVPAARVRRAALGQGAQVPVSPQWHAWPVPQPQPQPDWLAGAAWQPQVQAAPTQSEQRQAKVSMVFMSGVLVGLGYG